MAQQNHLSIMADIGGTNTRVALADGLSVRGNSIRRYKNAESDGLGSILKTYLAEFSDAKPVSACAAIAGPVRDGKGSLTNLEWTIDRDLLTGETGAEMTSVINDLQAQGHAVEHLAPSSCRVIQTGLSAGSHAARLVVGVGTGFNAAPVFRADTITLVPPGENGHVDLPRPNDELRGFAAYFEDRNEGFCSVEDAMSGRGLTHIYDWLASLDGSSETKSPPEIMTACENGSDPRALKTVGVFARILGTVCGNLALSNLPFGGIYLVGGVARAVTPYLKDNGFVESFSAKGRFTDFMAQFPIVLVDDDYAALTGMAALLHELRNGPPHRD